MLEHSAKEGPSKTALVFGDKRFTYEQVNAVANQVAIGLASADIAKSDKVALRYDHDRVRQRHL